MKRRLPTPTGIDLAVPEPYAALANDYDWLFTDDELHQGVAINLPGTARLLSDVPRGSVALDAACGTGVDAAVLAVAFRPFTFGGG